MVFTYNSESSFVETNKVEKNDKKKGKSCREAEEATKLCVCVMKICCNDKSFK